MSKALRDTALMVLDLEIVIEAVNPLLIIATYEDEKLVVEGTYPYNWNGTDDYESIGFALKLPPKKSEQLPFAMSRHGKEYTTVFRYDIHTIYYRPGRWEKYLAQLADKAQAKRDANSMLNGIGVDDSGLFPDLEP